MSSKPTILERAYQLAKSGQCPSTVEVREMLTAEGYENVESQIYGRTLVADLKRLCRAACAAQQVDK